MKFLMLSSLFFSLNALSAPVLNVNLAEEDATLKVWPDHKDPDQFYFSPTSIVLHQIHGFNIGPHNKMLVFSSFKLDTDEMGLEIVKEKILSKRPYARFSAIPFAASEVSLVPEVLSLLNEENCSGISGNFGDQVQCNFVLNDKGTKTFTRNFRSGIMKWLNYEYSVSGVIKAESNQYENSVQIYSLEGFMGGIDIKF